MMSARTIMVFGLLIAPTAALLPALVPGVQDQPADASMMEPTPGFQDQPTDASMALPAPEDEDQVADDPMMEPTQGFQDQPTDASMALLAPEDEDQPADDPVMEPTPGSQDQPTDASMALPAPEDEDQAADAPMAKQAWTDEDQLGDPYIVAGDGGPPEAGEPLEAAGEPLEAAGEQPEAAGEQPEAAGEQPEAEDEPDASTQEQAPGGKGQRELQSGVALRGKPRPAMSCKKTEKDVLVLMLKLTDIISGVAVTGKVQPPATAPKGCMHTPPPLMDSPLVVLEKCYHVWGFTRPVAACWAIEQISRWRSCKEQCGVVDNAFTKKHSVPCQSCWGALRREKHACMMTATGIRQPCQDCLTKALVFWDKTCSATCVTMFAVPNATVAPSCLECSTSYHEQRQACVA